MNNFKKRYLDTFNDIHAPNSIKEEVICMSKNLNNNEQSKNSNHVVETNNVEVSNGFHYNRFIAIATCVALICGGAFGFNYLLKDNDSLEPTTTESESTTSTVDTTLNSSVSNTSVVGNDNFKDIFGVNVQDCEFNTCRSIDSFDIFQYCNTFDGIYNIVGCFNTNSWEKHEDVSILDKQTFHTIEINFTNKNTQSQDSIVLHFSILKDVDDIKINDISTDVYVGIEYISNNVSTNLSTYKIDIGTYRAISSGLSYNNSIEFENNGSININNETITDKNILKNLTTTIIKESWLLIEDTSNIDFNKPIFNITEVCNGTPVNIDIYNGLNQDKYLYLKITFPNMNTNNYDLCYRLKFSSSTDELIDKTNHLINLIYENTDFLGVTDKPFDKLSVNETPMNDKTINNIINTLNYDTWELLDDELDETNALVGDCLQLSTMVYYDNGDLKQTIFISIYSNGYIDVSNYYYLEGVSEKDTRKDGDWTVSQIYAHIQKYYKASPDIYTNLTKIINLGDKTATNTTKITTSTSTTTATTTITTPVETTVDSTTNSIINTTVVPQTDEPVTTKKIYNIATPQLDYVININNPDTLPQFLTQEQQQLLCYAYSIVQGFAFDSPFEYVQEDTIIHNNHTYSRIKSPEINTVQDVKQYFEQYLTESFIDGYINMNSFIEQNGHAYGLNGARGGNIYYLGHTFVLDSQTDDRIEFHADAYYQTDDDGFDMYTGDYFYNQEPTVPYEVRTCKYVLVKTDDGWRFDEITVLI